jgi:soluble lytic murein transglycosylase-like protein
LKIIHFSIIILIAYVLTGCSSKSLNQKFKEQSEKYKVNYKTIHAICKKESNLNANVVNVNKSIFDVQRGPHYFSNSISANIYMDFVLDPLFLNYDIGICQINSNHLKRLKLDNEELLDEEKNIEVAAKIYKYNLKACKNRIMCALSMYNTGYKNSTIGKKYARRVLKERKKLYGR